MKLSDNKFCLLFLTHFSFLISKPLQVRYMSKIVFKQDSCNQVFTTLPHSLTLLLDQFYLPLLSHSFILP